MKSRCIQEANAAAPHAFIKDKGRNLSLSQPLNNKQRFCKIPDYDIGSESVEEMEGVLSSSRIENESERTGGGVIMMKRGQL